MKILVAAHHDELLQEPVERLSDALRGIGHEAEAFFFPFNVGSANITSQFFGLRLMELNCWCDVFLSLSPITDAAVHRQKIIWRLGDDIAFAPGSSSPSFMGMNAAIAEARAVFCATKRTQREMQGIGVTARLLPFPSSDDVAWRSAASTLVQGTALMSEIP
ncbi:hypothetical protein [Brevundimonas sp.]|uniref:hypothetical protein n=1 Tax=Brevundimonas sp. TaxID=1871086 RepID=UPI00289A7CB6|nr:hypothetical protein [Brevundimonas sp.]